MSAVTQYIELFCGHRAMIDANGAGPLNLLRDEACRVLEKHLLPAKGAEDYQDTDLDAMLAPDFGLNLDKIEIDVNPAATFRCDVPLVKSSLFLMENDTLVSAEGAEDALPEGVLAGSLRKFARECPDLVGKYYGKAAGMENPIVALDTMFAQDGLFLYVPRGVRLERPVQLVNILSNPHPLMAVRRVLVVLEEGAEAKILVCDHTQRDGVQFMDLQTVELFVAAGARLDYYELEESSRETSRLSALYLRQGADSCVTVDGITLFNGESRNEYFCDFEGEGASLRLYGMNIGDESRKVSTYSRINHAVPRCQSDELFKYAVDDNARADFTGRIHVAPGAVKTEAYQSNRSLVGSDSSKVFSKPQLEIYNDDVKCSHGCAIGQLDPMQMFYMRTRGLPEADARLLLRQAFMADVIDAVGIDSLRDRLRLLVERRFAGADTACSSCRGGENLCAEQCG